MYLEDKELIELARHNPDQFAPIYQKYAERVYKYFWFRVGFQKDLAEECTQETFFQAWKHLSSFTDRGASYLSYLLKIAHNQLLNHYRTSSRQRTVPLDDLDEAVFSYEQDYEKLLTPAQLQTVLQELSEQERTVIMMRYDQDASFQEIGEKIGKSENAVKLMISRARKKLKKNAVLAHSQM